ncbi:hypothetical protein RRG08_039474 [Elysia crispata]|uniref:Uncharacterized protein n=1 Tax=Elysia crispata TaxID=231223 RepID=A0AAE0YJY3_9GAST|nr:hypothetical protein RRG08_039474 [Elysia crispata]
MAANTWCTGRDGCILLASCCFHQTTGRSRPASEIPRVIIQQVMNAELADLGSVQPPLKSGSLTLRAGGDL